MTIIQLYKIHINPEPTGTEIHGLFSRFGIQGIVIDPKCLGLDLKWHSEKIEMCKQWIIKNSKL